MTSRHRGLLRKDCFGETPKVRAGLAFARETRALPRTRSERRIRSSVFLQSMRIIVEDALLIICVGIALRELRARRDTSC